MTKRVTFSGVLIATGQANIRAAAQALESAYSADGGDWALYHDNNSKSHIFVNNSGSHGGTRVDFSWAQNDPADYATGSLQYNIGVEATYPVLLGAIVEYKESVDITGNAGPVVAWDQTIFGPPQAQQIRQRSLVRATQRGSAVGYGGYVTVPQPLWPQWLQNENIGQGSDTPNKEANSFFDYPSRWSYSFVSPVPLFGVPRPR